MYLRKNETRRMRKAIFEPLTTRMWEIPLCVNVCFVSSQRSSIDPIVIPRIVPATSRGKCLCISLAAAFRILARTLDPFFSHRENIGAKTDPYPFEKNENRSYPTRGNWRTSLTFPRNEISSPIQRERLTGISTKIYGFTSPHKRKPRFTHHGERVSKLSKLSKFVTLMRYV